MFKLVSCLCVGRRQEVILEGEERLLDWQQGGWLAWPGNCLSLGADIKIKDLVVKLVARISFLFCLLSIQAGH